MSISKKIRFEVFKRDGFTCAYCGKTPPAVTLEADHIDPKSKGGIDDINNLITACFDCNRGKKDIPLDKIPNKINENLEILQEQEEQLKQFRNFIKKIDRRLDAGINNVQNVFSVFYPKGSFTPTFRISVKNFLKKLPENIVIESMENAASRGFAAERALSYFCGVCWSKIKGDDLLGKCQ